MHFSWRAIGSVALVIGAAYLIQSEPVTSFITSTKEGNVVSVFQTMETPALKAKIQQEALKRNERPIDARMDSVWKGIPGYAGREVDVEATYKKTLKSGNESKILWVYREIPVKKNLAHLGAVPVYRGNEHKKAVALMVNVAWGSEHLGPMLTIFRDKNVKVTFFLDGSWLAKNADLAKKLVAAGHEIGNHGYSHAMMSKITKDRVRDEIKRTEDLIHQKLNVKSKWFAPPAGDYDQRTVNVAKSYSMNTVLWTVDTVDWKKNVSSDLIVQRVKSKLQPGNLILMHPTDRTVKALPQIIAWIHSKGWAIQPVTEVLSPKRIDKD